MDNTYAPDAPMDLVADRNDQAHALDPIAGRILCGYRGAVRTVAILDAADIAKTGACAACKAAL